MPCSAPLYTSSVLFWGARFGFALSNILVSLPIKKKKKKNDDGVRFHLKEELIVVAER